MRAHADRGKRAAVDFVNTTTFRGVAGGAIANEKGLQGVPCSKCSKDGQMFHCLFHCLSLSLSLSLSVCLTVAQTPPYLHCCRIPGGHVRSALHAACLRAECDKSYSQLSSDANVDTSRRSLAHVITCIKSNSGIPGTTTHWF